MPHVVHSAESLWMMFILMKICIHKSDVDKAPIHHAVSPTDLELHSLCTERSKTSREILISTTCRTFLRSNLTIRTLLQGKQGVLMRVGPHQEASSSPRTFDGAVHRIPPPSLTWCVCTLMLTELCMELEGQYRNCAGHKF